MMTLGGTFSRFLLVGGACTGLQYAVLIALVQLFGVDPTVASTAGFALGAAVNYALSHMYTFRSTRKHATAFPRFVVTATAGAALNGAIMFVGVEMLRLAYLLAQVAATIVVLGWNFVVHLKWSFAPGE
jgi:putative flippase GtrA